MEYWTTLANSTPQAMDQACHSAGQEATETNVRLLYDSSENEACHFVTLFSDWKKMYLNSANGANRSETIGNRPCMFGIRVVSLKNRPQELK